MDIHITIHTNCISLVEGNGSYIFLVFTYFNQSTFIKYSFTNIPTIWQIAEAPIIWPPDAESGKDPDAGKDWRQEEKGATEDQMLGWHHWLTGHKFEQVQGDVRDRKAWLLRSMRSQRVRHDWATEQQHYAKYCSSQPWKDRKSP